MPTRNLLSEPLWRPEDLGHPLPDSPHACSVCLPTWSSVIGYEEADPRVTGRMQAGYPRFFCHPTVTRLFDAVAAGRPECRALVFPSEQAARLAAEFISRDGASAEIVPVPGAAASGVLFEARFEKRARLFWRYCGLGVSSRLAEAILERWERHRFAATEHAGRAAGRKIAERLGQLSGQPVENVFLFSSGMAGVFATHRALTLMFPGRRTAQLGFPYVDVIKVQEEFGAGVHLLPGVGPRDLETLAEITAREPLAGIFTEVPSNPLIECADLERVAAVARSHKVPLVCDDTVATIVNADSFRFADVVTTSLTKAFSGAGDVMGGCVIVNQDSPWAADLRTELAAEMSTAPLFGADAVVLERNSIDFIPRVAQMNAGAEAVASFLQAHRAVGRVYYPTLDGSAGYEKVRRPRGGFGMLLSFTLRDPASTPQVFDALRVCKGPSLGTNFSLACPYTLLAHYHELDWAESCGVSRHLVRVSAGLESPDDLCRRFGDALALAPS